MLDRKFILENVEAVKTNCQNRGVTCDVDRLVELEELRRNALKDAEEFNRQANEVAKKIGKASSDSEREALKEMGKQLRDSKARAQASHDDLETQILGVQQTIPNMAHPQCPIGGDDSANLVLKYGKHTPRIFDFKPLDHLELGQRRNWIDFEGGARTTGAGFYFLKGNLVLLDLALQQFAVNFLHERGFLPTLTPDLALDEILFGIGFMPRGPETQVYSIENSPLSLIGTAEITLGGLYSGETMFDTDLPLRLCGISHCYRTEAGAAGRASRGLYRVHQFTKVEMFAFTLPEQSEAMHDELLRIECDIFDALEIPYQVVDTATGDLGGPAYRKFDLEAWMPGRGDNGEYGEVTSTSNCTDYQARRLNIRYKVKDQKGTKYVHTLNGTAIALSRALIAILENHQNQDGSVNIPACLHPWINKTVI
ncbi:MAG TPA: serine--tRNA ligase [Pirellulaceae bacterium]|nr:serine--tRNA ligase [Pirellulaceae bacterium]HMO91082.1 serine--tRNA ligase [Pirellulaceae bacterium]HMP71181.1 serine--tRNA ligase [Pirellulaceae bacterium]